ncbi:MAG: hypothetical protein LUD02_16135 [Tannerellaceae bacterium]|nr:hypothetical protein [Tannerellaceae bacterium]MCD8265488.1 hypothetical protein [Tannerellaceae bacterium]
MGSFDLLATSGKKIFAHCKIKGTGKEKRFELSPFVNDNIAIRITEKDHLYYLSVQKPFHLQEQPLKLKILYREDPIYNHLWDHTKTYQTLKKEDLPTGIIQLLISDHQDNPISERCIFNLITEI